MILQITVNPGAHTLERSPDPYIRVYCNPDETQEYRVLARHHNNDAVTAEIQRIASAAAAVNGFLYCTTDTLKPGNEPGMLAEPVLIHTLRCLNAPNAKHALDNAASPDAATRDAENLTRPGALTITVTSNFPVSSPAAPAATENVFVAPA